MCLTCVSLWPCLLVHISQVFLSFAASLSGCPREQWHSISFGQVFFWVVGGLSGWMNEWVSVPKFVPCFLDFTCQFCIYGILSIYLFSFLLWTEKRLWELLYCVFLHHCAVLPVSSWQRKQNAYHKWGAFTSSGLMLHCFHSSLQENTRVPANSQMQL